MMLSPSLVLHVHGLLTNMDFVANDFMVIVGQFSRRKCIIHKQHEHNENRHSYYVPNPKRSYPQSFLLQQSSTTWFVNDDVDETMTATALLHSNALFTGIKCSENSFMHLVPYNNHIDLRQSHIGDPKPPMDSR